MKQKEQMKAKRLRDRRQHRWHIQSFVKLQFASFKYWAKGLVCIPAAAWQAAGNSSISPQRKIHAEG